MEYIAHYRLDDDTPQLLREHLMEVQQHCEEIGEKIQAKHIVGLAGMLHDFGKYSTEFQQYIREAIANPEAPPKRGSVNHSTAGGQMLLLLTKANPLLQQVCELIANAIYGHHSTLLDFINIDGESPFMNRHHVHDEMKMMMKQFFQEVIPTAQFNRYLQQVLQEYKALLQKSTNHRVLHFFLTKYIFSALIDADRTNARLFDEKIVRSLKEAVDFSIYEQRLHNALQQKQQHAIQNTITKGRQYLSNQCFQKATLPTGIYTLSIPTGGGKTLASLRFALRHAQLQRKERILQIIPFTTIIEQNAKEVRTILQADHQLLEHHSNIVEEVANTQRWSYEQQEQRRSLQRAKDTWDVPFVFSTMVQFLNIVYEKQSRYTRRFHQLANSIIIFDEIQSLPIKTISMFNEVLTFLKEICHTTIILCTATQPALDEVKHRIRVEGELIDDLENVMPSFRRTSIIPKIQQQEWTIEQVATFAEEQMEHVNNLLIIANTKRHAQQLFQQLKEKQIAQVTHLSTSMCPKHRQYVLANMREQLQTNEKLICISTQLIEAGVDVSFQCVIRALAGLDSIAQAAGRCNRNGEVESRDVYVINMQLPKAHFLPTIVAGAQQTSIVLRDMQRDMNLYGGNILAPTAMKRYFSLYYDVLKHEQQFPLANSNHHLYDLAFSANGGLVNARLAKQLSHRHAFKTVGQHFEVVESATTAVLVPYGDVGKALIAQLEAREIEDFSLFLKRAQHYSVNVFSYERQLLEQHQMLAVYETPFSRIYYVREGAYNDEDGISIQGEAPLEAMFF